MSDQWYANSTGEFAGVSYLSRRGTAFDFGAHDNAHKVISAAVRGEGFNDQENRMDSIQFLAWLTGQDRLTPDGVKWTTGRRFWTFGEFGGTMELGSGDLATWEGM